jgi:hypothetical protein
VTIPLQELVALAKTLTPPPASTREIRVNSSEWNWLKSRARPTQSLRAIVLGIQVIVSELIPDNRAVLIDSEGNWRLVLLRDETDACLTAAKEIA